MHSNYHNNQLSNYRPQYNQNQNLYTRERKYLRFNAKNEESNFIINFFIDDDTAEIREINETDKGREQFPVFLKRTRIPKQMGINQPGHREMYSYYTDKDIYPMMNFIVYSRPFKILGCDEFTAKYYLSKYHMNFPIGGFEPPPKKEQPKFEIPPYNGFGSEEDSLANCLNLKTVPLQKDYSKYINYENIVLRFLACLSKGNPEDVDRRFLVAFYLSDDSVAVFELGGRNSGVREGKFLERRKYKNIKKGNKPFTIYDFVEDRNIIINSFYFYLIDPDEFTKKWINENLSVK